MSQFYKHYSEIKVWPWSYFKPSEIASRDSGEIVVDNDAMTRLQNFRILAKCPVILNSAYRSVVHNKAEGGSPSSQHLKGKAFDVRISAVLPREKIHQLAKLVGFKGIGDYNTFVHIDTGATRYWDYRSK